MATSPRPRTKPRQPGIGDASAQPPVDSTPDDIFIRVYPARLRALIASKELTRAQLGALLVLALRMDEDRICYPARRRTTSDTAYSSERWTAALLRKLESKGAIEVERQNDQSHTYRLPDCFGFGRKSERGGVRKSDNPDDGNPYPNNNHAPRIFSKKEESSTVKEVLITAGVKPREAELMADQYSSALIQQVISEAGQKAAQQQISNPGAWIRVTLEKRSGQQIRYSSTAAGEHHAASKPKKFW